jgi:hypothetical protein
VSRHIAEGAKHFEATDSRHKQVRGTRTSPGGFQRNAFQSNAFQVTQLTITLDASDAATLSIGRTVNAVQLAERVLNVLATLVP